MDYQHQLMQIYTQEELDAQFTAKKLVVVSTLLEKAFAVETTNGSLSRLLGPTRYMKWTGWY